LLHPRRCRTNDHCHVRSSRCARLHPRPICIPEYTTSTPPPASGFDSLLPLLVLRERAGERVLHSFPPTTHSVIKPPLMNRLPSLCYLPSLLLLTLLTGCSPSFLITPVQNTNAIEEVTVEPGQGWSPKKIA